MRLKFCSLFLFFLAGLIPVSLAASELIQWDLEFEPNPNSTSIYRASGSLSFKFDPSAMVVPTNGFNVKAAGWEATDSRLELNGVIYFPTRVAISQHYWVREDNPAYPYQLLVVSIRFNDGNALYWELNSYLGNGQRSIFSEEFSLEALSSPADPWGVTEELNRSNMQGRVQGGTLITQTRAKSWNLGRPDDDDDGVLNAVDNCPATPNPEQNDLDNDGIGDACDSDIDGDLVDNDLDNCPLVSNQDQLDADLDLIGDACDDLIDNDADGIANDLDNCPAVPNADQANNDQDGFGDACDADDDNDTVEDTADNCPLIANEDQADNEGDNIGDVCDSDDDNDAVEDTIDNCPLIANLGQEDNDSDGAGDVCDSDDDSDLIEDELDNCPLTFNPDQANSDGVGAGDACNDEFDLDDDDWENDFDNCPNVANRNQSDFDGDSTGDACDTDVDNDGVSNASDSCPLTPLGALVGSSGCSIEQLCPCDAPRQSTLPWKNHGQFVSCVTQAANTFYKEGLITGEEKGRITEEAAQSACGF